MFYLENCKKLGNALRGQSGAFLNITAVVICNIFIGDILKRLELRGNISTRLIQCSAYADDILITART